MKLLSALRGRQAKRDEKEAQAAEVRAQAISSYAELVVAVARGDDALPPAKADALIAEAGKTVADFEADVEQRQAELEQARRCLRGAVNEAVAVDALAESAVAQERLRQADDRARTARAHAAQHVLRPDKDKWTRGLELAAPAAAEALRSAVAELRAAEVELNAVTGTSARLAFVTGRPLAVAAPTVTLEEAHERVRRAAAAVRIAAASAAESVQ